MLCDRLYEIRLEKGETKDQFANELGLWPSTYRNYEDAFTFPNMKALVLIAAAGYDLNDLLSEEIEKAKEEKKRLEEHKDGLKRMRLRGGK